MTRVIFDNVWYLPDENRWRDMNMLAMRDYGSLFVNEESLEFQGGNEKVKITDIKKVSYGKQGRDFINNWVRVDYGMGKTAFFADGRWLGWGGIFGGTKMIFNALHGLQSAFKEP